MSSPEKYHREDKYFCPEDISTKLDQSIKNIVEKSGFIKYKIDKKCVSTNGGNYLGLLYEIDVKGETKKGDKELNLFVKSVIPGENNLEVISISSVYNSEVFIYNELSKIFNELQDEAHVPIDERYKMVKSYDESNSEAIIMENLSRKGFSTGYRMDEVSIQFAEAAIQELAKFHAFSFVLKEKRPKYFEANIETKKSPYIVCEQWQTFIQSMVKLTINNVDEDVKRRVEKFSVGIADRFAGNFNDENIKRCLCHGDYKQANILAEIVDGKITEIIPVDFQLIHYGCPVLDLHYFIFTSTDQDFRRLHLSHLKDLYHETLTKFLKYFDLDVNSFYPWKEFDKEFEEKIDHGLMVSLLHYPFIFASEEDVPNIMKDKKEDLSFEVDDRLKDRIGGIINDYIEWGIL